MKCNIKQIQELVLEIMRETINVCEKNNITYYCQAGTVLGAIRHSGIIPWDKDADLIIPSNEMDKFIECASRDLPKKYYVDYYTINPKGNRNFPRIGIRGYSTITLHVDVFWLIGIPNNREEQLNMVKEAKEITALTDLKRYSYFKYLKKLKIKQVIKKYKLSKIKTVDIMDKFTNFCKKYPYDKAKYVMNPSGKYGEKNIFEKEVYGKGIKKKFNYFDAIIPTQYDFYLKQYYGDYMKIPNEKEINEVKKKIYNVK